MLAVDSPDTCLPIDGALNEPSAEPAEPPPDDRRRAFDEMWNVEVCLRNFLSGDGSLFNAERVCR